jgi:hypothetical protein
MSFLKKLLMIAAVVSLLTGFYGCKKEGPAERAGKKVDKAMDDFKKQIDDASK